MEKFFIQNIPEIVRMWDAVERELGCVISDTLSNMRNLNMDLDLRKEFTNIHLPIHSEEEKGPAKECTSDLEVKFECLHQPLNTYPHWEGCMQIQLK